MFRRGWPDLTRWMEKGNIVLKNWNWKLKEIDTELKKGNIWMEKRKYCSHSQKRVFTIHLLFRNSVLLFLFLAVFLILKFNSCKRSNNSHVSPFVVAIIKTWLATWFYSLLLLLSGDVELTTVPKRNYSNAFFICFWNLISISAHNYAKIFLLKAYLAVHRFDITCISETCLDSSTPSDDNLEISGYTLVRSDHPSNNTIRGVCIYYKAFYL